MSNLRMPYTGLATSPLRVASTFSRVFPVSIPLSRGRLGGGNTEEEWNRDTHTYFILKKRKMNAYSVLSSSFCSSGRE